MRVVASLVTAVVIQALPSAALLRADDNTFDARWSEAEENVRAAPGEQYFNEVFFKEFFSKYAVHVNECTRRTGEQMTTDLRAAVQLGADGDVLAVLVRPESAPAKCFAELVEKDTFSRPPSGQFWLPVTVRFTNP